MTRRTFNWNYHTAHELGQSHVADQSSEEAAFVQDTASLDPKAYRAAYRKRQQGRDERLGIGKPNANQLPNIYA